MVKQQVNLAQKFAMLIKKHVVKMKEDKQRFKLVISVRVSLKFLNANLKIRIIQTQVF